MTKNFDIKTSNTQGNKKTITSFALILILATSMMIVFVQPTLAQVGVPQPEKTVGYIDVAPLLVGVGQTATVNLFIYPLPTNYAYRPFYDGFRGVTVTFVRPDGTKDTFMPVDGTHVYAPGQTQSLGAIYFMYEPNMAGNWSVSFTMPDQNLTDATGTVLYTGCASNTVTFTVQTDPVLAGLLNGYPWSPLPDPNVYWKYPINSNNREWYQISGDWLGTAMSRGPVNGPGLRNWQPYGSGPNTSHIVWKQPLKSGGLMGGDYGSLSYGSQSARVDTVIMEGKLFANSEYASKVTCIELATGEVLYTMNNTITAGFHMPGTAYQQATNDPSVLLENSYGNSIKPFLFQTSGSTWNLYDTFTGALVISIVNASSAQLIDGSELAYGTRSGNLFRWNMSKVITLSTYGTAITSTAPWPTGIEWQAPLPKPLGANAVSLFGVSADASTVVVTSRNEFWGYSAATGAKLWNLTLNYPITGNQQCVMQGVDDFVVLDPVASTFKVYSMLTGAFLWESDSFNDDTWATTWTVYVSTANDYDNLYSMFPDGTVRAYSLADGHEVWRSKAFPSTEYVNNVVPYVESIVLVGGKIYVCAGYSPSYKINPVSRFGMVVCIDAATGENLWTLNGGLRPSSAAGGYVIATGDNDGNLYGIGKGKTSTTITAPLTTVSAGTSVLIQGTVMDMSPAAPNTPAVSDADMSEWMDYLYMQNATLLNNPPAPKGVPVKLVAVGSNGNTIDIGTVTSDSSGSFSEMWEPPSEGKYTVYATFDGSNSYYGSYAQTALGVTKASTETSTQQQTIPDYTMTIIYGVIAIIIAVVISVAIAVLVLRKR